MLIIAPILAFILLAIAIIVAIGGPGAFDASPSPAAAAATTSPSQTLTTRPTVSPSAEPDAELPCASLPAPLAGPDELLVYFDCGGPPHPPRPVVRGVGDLTAVDDRLRLALGALLDGPSAEERALGYSGFLPDGSGDAIKGVETNDATAVIDFSTALTVGALNSSHNRFIVFETLGATIRQFNEIDAVEFRIDGSCDAFASYFESTCTFVRARDGILGDWLLIGGFITGERVTMNAAEPITVVIETDSLHGQAPCNVFGAPLHLDGSDISVGSIEASEAPCADEVMAKEAAYLLAISRATTARRDEDQLVLTGPDVELRYAELSAVLPGD